MRTHSVLIVLVALYAAFITGICATSSFFAQTVQGEWHKFSTPAASPGSGGRLPASQGGWRKFSNSLASSTPEVTSEAPATVLTTKRLGVLDTVRRSSVAQAWREIQDLAVTSEKCRIEHTAKDCGLPDEVLSSSDLSDVYTYYVTEPIERSLQSTKPSARRENWIWGGKGNVVSKGGRL